MGSPHAPGRYGAHALIRLVAILTAVLSLVSWAYRFVDDHMHYDQLLFYVLVPAVVWLLLAGPLFLLRNRRKPLRVLAAILLVPTSVLWAISIVVGFFGLKIH